MDGNSRGGRWFMLAERTIAVALGATLMGSAATHIGNPQQFLSSVYSYQIAGPGPGLLVAAALPGAQIAIGWCLALNWWPRPAYFAALLLFLGFVGVQTSAAVRGLEISCGCFGVDAGPRVGAGTLSVAGACALGSLVGLFLTRWSSGRDRPGGAEGGNHADSSPAGVQPH